MEIICFSLHLTIIHSIFNGLPPINGVILALGAIFQIRFSNFR
jgi:hypothetical protein